MLPAWNPDRLLSKLPANVALIGGRRMGKSSCLSDLLQRMRRRFDLVLAFVGSASCNPVLQFQMRQNWDDRFFFNHWDESLIERLLVQQEDLKQAGSGRRVLIILDDVILGSKAQDQICHLAMRGRHFNISMIMCAVSYISVPKQMRRSLDVLMVFSCPMEGDMKTLTWEFANNTSMAKFALRNLEMHHCLVLETLERRQKLFVWKANLLTLRNAGSPARERLRTLHASDSASEHQTVSDQTGTVEPSNRMRFPAESTSHPALGSVVRAPPGDNRCESESPDRDTAPV